MHVLIYFLFSLYLEFKEEVRAVQYSVKYEVIPITFTPGFCIPPLVEMDSHFSTHAGKQREALVIINNDGHRDALAHFGEVAAAVVLRWKQRKCTGCCAYNLID